LVFIANKNGSSKAIISNLIKKGQIQNGQLRYRIYLSGILPIGEAILGTEQIEEYQGQKVYHLNAKAESSKLFSKFFSGYAALDSYLDMQQLPILFRQKAIVTGKQDINKEVFYNQSEGFMSIGGVKRQIFPNTHDPLSAVFNLRRMDLEKASDFEMNLNTNQKNYILEGTTEQKALLINKKIFKIFVAKAEIRRQDNNPYHKSNITVVFLKEKENIPILIKVFASGVLINAKLIEIE